MLNFIDKILYGIFTEPTTSVVAILIAIILLFIWLYIKQLKHSIEVQSALMEEFKNSNNRYNKVMEDHTALDLKIKDTQVKAAENSTMLRRAVTTLDALEKTSAASQAKINENASLLKRVLDKMDIIVPRDVKK